MEQINDKIINTKSEISKTEYHFNQGDMVKIYTSGIPGIPLGHVNKIIRKTSKFIHDYYLYQVAYDLDSKHMLEWFYANELYPEDVEITKKKKKKNYINNRDMLRSILGWLEERKENDKAPIPTYLWECFLKLAENIAHSNWHHTHREDMIQQAVYICGKYAHNFNEEISINCFSYFTRYIKNAFAQVHNNEKNLIDAKFNYIKNLYCDNPYYDYREREEDEEY